jgi:hypothetical protein
MDQDQHRELVETKMFSRPKHEVFVHEGTRTSESPLVDVGIEQDEVFADEVAQQTIVKPIHPSYTWTVSN